MPDADAGAAPAPPVAKVDFETQRAVEAFLYRQAEILDDGRWEDWLDLFAPDGRYWMPARADQTQGDGVPNIFWEDLDLMRVRVRRNTHPHAWSQNPPNRLSHVVSNVAIESVADSGDVIVRSKFHCSEYLRYEVRHFAGKYRHHLVRARNGKGDGEGDGEGDGDEHGGGYRIRLQRVDLLNAEGPFDYVIQWWL